MTDQPSYYSIITANVRYDNRLTDSEKLLFAEITSLSNKYGYCTASNGYFAKLYEVTKVTVSRRIANLKECGYLHVEIIRNGNEIKQRKLYPLTEMIRPINTNDNTPIITNVKENNTSINNTSNNNINRVDILSGNPTRIPYKEIIDYLNEKTGKKFKHNTTKTKDFIKARWNQDFRLEDFKKVIDIKTAEWLNTDSDKYLRPETLFGNKFEGYLNQKVQPTGTDQLERMKYDESYWD
ncbi:TPA: conserved phage C-terminal domain-containing protein [Staphylococcus aureus]|nr:conserved phage C-terminal domain-containing protein [Staphylococcus aureus]HDX8308817.1 conserved phage C-terminal domain-containing protein [Staphylococcus aureus]